MRRQLSSSVSAFLLFNLGLVALLGCLANFAVAVAVSAGDDDADDYYPDPANQYDPDDYYVGDDDDDVGDGDESDEVYYPGADYDDENNMTRADTVMISACKAQGDDGSEDDECDGIKANDFPCQITACKDALKPKFCSFNYLDDDDVCPENENQPFLKNPPAPEGCTKTTSGMCFDLCKKYSKKTVSVLGQNYNFVQGVGNSYRCPIGKRTVCGCTSVAKKAPA